MSGEDVLVIEAVPAADGVNVAVTVPVPLAVIVVGANTPATVEAGVIISPAGHDPLGVNVNVTGTLNAPVVADRASVYVVAMAAVVNEVDGLVAVLPPVPVTVIVCAPATGVVIVNE